MKKIILSLIVLCSLSGLIAYFEYKPKEKISTEIIQTLTEVETVDSNLVLQPTPTVIQKPTTVVPTSANKKVYNDGNYSASSTNRFGPVSIKVTIKGGVISDVLLLSMPSSHRKSQEITDYSGPELVKETIIAQSATIDSVSGATYTSTSYISSLQKALDQAKNL